MSDYLDFAKEMALRAGDIILEHFQIGVPTENKADNSPLTLADTAVNLMVINEVAKRFPDHGVRGEEESSQKDHHEYVWVCDPIDGTIPYAYGIPTNVFSLALTVNGKPILGVVYDPYMKRLFRAEKGKGAYMNDKKIRVSTGKLEPKNPFGFNGGERLDSVGLYSLLKKRDLRVFSFHSCVYSAMLVATGQFDGHVYSSVHSHDIAACKIIIEEAGGRVTDLHGREQRYDMPINGGVMSNGLVHDELLAIIKPFLNK